MKLKARPFLFFYLLLLITLASAPVFAADAYPEHVYIPLAINGTGAAPSARAVNAPYLNDPEITQNRFSEMAVFWFGQLTQDQSFSDVRVAYNDTDLVVYLAVYDRIIAYDPNSNVGSDLTQWDTAALSLVTDSGVYSKPGANAYRFLVEVRWFEGQNNPKYQATYRGSGSGWSAQAVPFANYYGYMGTVPGDALEDKGWAVSFRIPYSSLGLSKPADGTTWRMHLEVFNRNSQAGPALGSQTWPETGSAANPSTWGNLRFGLPTYTPPALSGAQTVTVRTGLPGSVVKDVAVGGGSDCGGAAYPNYFAEWGDLNYNGRGDINIQNQGNISDWPCYSRYYLSFSLPGVPAGKIFRSARLSMSHMGGSDPTHAVPSWIQVLTVNEDWTESSANWNNTPLARENLGGIWVPVYDPNWSDPAIWSKLPHREWDVSLAVLDAYTRGVPLRLAMYSADKGGDGMHTGKYFVSNDTESWNAANRPTLVIEYVNP